MNNQLVRSRKHEDVYIVLLRIAHTLDELADEQACVLHCLQPHRSGFYRRLEREFGVRAIPCHPRGGGLKLLFSRIVLGASALIVVHLYEKLPALFLRIGEQSMVGLYSTNISTLASVSSLAQLNTSDILAAIKENRSHLVYQVDEDAAAGDGLVTELISVGPDCPKVLKDSVELNIS